MSREARPPQSQVPSEPYQARDMLSEVENLAREGRVSKAIEIANRNRGFINFKLRNRGMKERIQKEKPALAAVLNRTGFFGPPGQRPSA